MSQMESKTQQAGSTEVLLQRKVIQECTSDENKEKINSKSKQNNQKKKRKSKKKQKQKKQKKQTEIEIKKEDLEKDEQQSKSKKIKKQKKNKKKQKQVKIEVKIEVQSKSTSSKKSKVRKQPAKSQTISKTMRQISRISRTPQKKSNFYLDKIDCRKRGEPVGRGSKKMRQKMKQQKKMQAMAQRQRNFHNKKMKQDFLKEECKKEENNELKKPPIRPFRIKHPKIPMVNEDDEKNSQQPKQREKKFSKKTVNIRIFKHLIDLYSINAGDFPSFVRQIPELTKKQIRGCLKTIFNKGLDLIQKGMEEVCDKKVSPWKALERYQICRQLFRIRATNRLLSEQNHYFRELFDKLMNACLNSEVRLIASDIQWLFNKFQHFVRGYTSVTKRSQSFLKKLDKQFVNSINFHYVIDFEKQQQIEVKLADLSDDEDVSVKQEEVFMEFQWTKEQEQALIKIFLKYKQKQEKQQKKQKKQKKKEKKMSIIEIVTQQLKQEFQNHPFQKKIVQRKLEELLRKAINKLFEESQNNQKNNELLDNYFMPSGQFSKLVEEKSQFQRRLFSSKEIQSFKIKTALFEYLLSTESNYQSLSNIKKIAIQFNQFIEFEQAKLKYSNPFVSLKNCQDNKLEKENSEIKIKDQQQKIEKQKQEEREKQSKPQNELQN